jgi:hypothetical protein
MRTTALIARLAGLSCAGIVAFGAASSNPQVPAVAAPETVMATFHVVPGKETDFERVLVHEWETYTSGNLVFKQPHIIVRGREPDGKTYFVHIFTWISSTTPDHPPATVIADWQSMGPLVEARNGHPGMEIAKVEFVAPKN